MNKKIALGLLTLLFSANSIFSQNLTGENKKLFNEAKKSLEYEEYENALKNLEIVHKNVPDDYDVNFTIGKIYIIQKHEVRAYKYFKAAEPNSRLGEFNYLLALAAKYMHRFDEAIDNFNKFKIYKKEFAKTTPEDLAEIDSQISNCKNGIDFTANPRKVIIKNLGPGINSKYPDYVPCVSADESMIIFTSRRKNTTGGQIENDGHYFEDIYYSVKDDTTWTSALPINGIDINTESHDAAINISPDGQKLFVYKLPKGTGVGDIYSSDLKGNVWSEPKSLGNNVNTSAWEPSATINATEDLLFFTSNKKGGFGGRDIYVSKKQMDGTWGVAKNLGNKINTPEEEDGPYLHVDGKTLYFSSKAHNTMGGFDIFHCTIDPISGEVLSDPVNMGYPINTADDDIFFVWSADNKRAYFSSEREGGYGEKDIYVMSIDNAEESKLVVLKGKIKSCDLNKPITATITVTDNTTGKPIGIYTSNAKTGKYTVILPSGKNYGIAVQTDNYLFNSKNIDIPDLKGYQEYQDTICLKPIKVGSKIVLRNVFFDTNKSDLKNESVAELDRLVNLLKENPTINIEVSGHCDSDGNDDYNQKLSQSRSKSVYEYLIAKSIASSRLAFKGYGETAPMVPNDTPENKALNRRTEIKIMN